MLENKNIATLDLMPFTNPQSVAIIGASADFRKPNGVPLFMLLQRGFTGKIYPVNPNYDQIEGITCYPDLLQIPGTIDLAVVAVRAAQTLPVLQQCVQKKVKGVVILTSGFAEIGAEGNNLQEEIERLSYETGMHIIGPNCVGVISLPHNLWAAFAPAHLYENDYYKKRFNIISQSGFFGVSMYQMASREGLLFNKFYSVGNEADLGLPHLLEGLLNSEDPNTDNIACYIEGIKDRDGLLFKRAAEKALQKNKIISVIKVGQTEAGARAATSHTAALTGTDQVYNSFFKQKGIIRVPGPEQLLPLVTIIATGRLPKDNRVAIISDSGGGGVLMADKCQLYGLELAELLPETNRKLQEFLPFFASPVNPIDITSQIMVERDLAYKCLSVVEQDPNVDIIIVSFNCKSEGGDLITKGIIEHYQQSKKPLLAVFWPLGDEKIALQHIEKVKACGIPVFKEMDDFIYALAALTKRMAKAKRYEKPLLFTSGLEQEKALGLYHEYRKFTVEHNKDNNLAEENTLLPMSEYQMKRILSCYGIPVCPEKMIYSEKEALNEADKMGYPLALKVVSPAIAHKTEVGGVFLHINSKEAIKEAFQSLRKHLDVITPESPAAGLLLQRMLPPAVEVIIGMKRDPVFGPVIICGLGGVFVEVLNDISMRIAPLSRQDAEEMLGELKGHKILDGVRGRNAADKEAIIDILLKVSRLSLELGALMELDINPLLVFPPGQGAIAVDAWGYWDPSRKPL